MFPASSSDVRFARAHDWFLVQPDSAEIEHVRRSITQDGTGIRCCFDLIVDPSASRANDNVFAIFITYAAPVPIITFHPYFKQSPSNTAAYKVEREDAIAISCLVLVKLECAAVRAFAVGHVRSGVTRVQVRRSGAQNCIALRQ